MLTWGPCYYHQKQFFSGKDHPLSDADRLLRYDVEVSGFPSSHAGHLVPARPEGAGLPGHDADRGVADLGPARSCSGRAGRRRWSASRTPAGASRRRAASCPNYEMPAFDGIGANEYIVDVTHPDAVDFISAVDTPYPWELNIWYHTLNGGFRTRISGETDFPCIYDERVGAGRTYVKLDRLTIEGWLEAVRDGRTYVSDGVTHLMDFTVNGVASAARSEVELPRERDRARHGAGGGAARPGSRRAAARSRAGREAVLGRRACARWRHRASPGGGRRQRAAVARRRSCSPTACGGR